MEASLPEPWQKPAFQELVESLKALELKPLVWGVNVSTPEQLMQHENLKVQDRRETSRFLSSLISSNLTWIEDEDEREVIWNTASKRLAERCGRTAMGEITRAFPFSLECKRIIRYSVGVETKTQDFVLNIREPPLTGDSLGLKTWGSSYVLAKLLPELEFNHLRHLHLYRDEERVLELGSGTGLLGLAAACLWGTKVTLTDLPTIMPNLVYNVESNRETLQSSDSKADAATLTWGNPQDTDARFHTHHQFELVIAADPLYDDEHPSLLAGAIHEQLALDEEARALIMVPYRDETTRKLACKLRKQLRCQDPPIFCIEQTMVTGQDDWGDEEEGEHVDCWLGIFQRRINSVGTT